MEKLTGIPHGEAVGAGMVLAANLSVRRGLLHADEARRLERIVHSYGLPVRPPVDTQALLAAVRKDKKRDGARIHFVFLDALGSARVDDIPLDELQRMMKKMDG